MMSNRLEFSDSLNLIDFLVRTHLDDEETNSGVLKRLYMKAAGAQA